MSAHLIELLAESAAHRPGGVVAGAVIGIVTNNQDPDGANRVAVRFPWLGENVESWARIVAPMAGNGRGLYFMPEPEDEVLVMFERGDVRFPFIVGALWNGKDKPPVTDDEAQGNDVRIIKSRSGHVIKLNDKDGAETVEIVDKANNRIVFDTAANTLTITTAQDIKLAAPDGTIELRAKKISIKADTDAQFKANNVDVSADANLKLAGGSGVDIN